LTGTVTVVLSHADAAVTPTGRGWCAYVDAEISSAEEP
jgi:hypothetical protein